MKTALMAASLSVGLTALPAVPLSAADWPMFGQNLANTANSDGETAITVANVSRLKPKWIATTGGDVSARPAVVGGVVYFPDWGGNLYALNAATGQVIWQNQISAYGLPAGTVARSSPTVVNGILYIGALTGGYLLALNAATGELAWKTSLDSHPKAIVTGSPTVVHGVVFAGVASTEEGAAGFSGYQCCSFRGSVVALSAATGQIYWKTFTVPANYSGGAVWGSSPVVDLTRHLVYVATGNNYAKPTDPTYLDCIGAGGAEGACLSPEDYLDSVLALDTSTGAVKWSKRLRDDDDWNTACLQDMPGAGNCPVGAGPDYDFGSMPNEFPVGSAMDIGAGQKSGIYSAFDADTGQLLWAQQVGPGGSLGGILWGSATDGARIYVAIGNPSGQSYAGGTAGSWAALDAVSGNILWQVPDLHGSVDLAPMAVSNGVVYAGSMAAAAGQSNMVALDAATGKVLWKYPSGGSVVAGAVISGGTVYWGSGYSHLGPPYVGNNKFYAFTIDGQ